MEIFELGTILQMTKGKTPATQSAEPKAGYMPYVDIEAFETGVIKLYTTGEKCVPCKDGDILIVCDGSRSGLVGKAISGYVGSTLAKISARGIDNQYLYYFLQGKYAIFNTKKKGTGTPHLKPELLKAQKIYVPDYPEQQRIVSQIEEQLSQLDNSVETLNKVKQQLAMYRQAVLKEAFSSITDYVTMDKVATMIDPQPSHRTPPEYDGGVPYIGIGDIDYDKSCINFDGAHKVNPAVLREQKTRYTLQRGDFVMGKIGTIGKPFRVHLPQNYTLSANIILIQPKREKINSDYLYWQFVSPYIERQLSEGSKATTQAAFGIKKARLLKIKMCGLDMQEIIVRRIEKELSVCESIEQTVISALQQSEAMRHSILKQAFGAISKE